MNKNKVKKNINLEVVWAVKMCFLLCVALSQRAFVLVFFSAKMNRRVENRFYFLCFTTVSRNRNVEMLLKSPKSLRLYYVFMTIQNDYKKFTLIIVYFI